MWVQERLLRILRGEACLVAAGIRRSATRRKLTPDNRENVDQCADYLLNHASYLHYDECLAAGFRIATGVIEGACRHLVSDRMDLTGARWSLAGAEAVLRLRALRSSGDFLERLGSRLNVQRRVQVAIGELVNDVHCRVDAVLAGYVAKNHRRRRTVQ